MPVYCRAVSRGSERLPRKSYVPKDEPFKTKITFKWCPIVLVVYYFRARRGHTFALELPKFVGVLMEPCTLLKLLIRLCTDIIPVSNGNPHEEVIVHKRRVLSASPVSNATQNGRPNMIKYS
ncbi:hypothetical protein PoB_004758400 [Plakobranchus ocellatus]|uniref:Uncharacterized protein n=1 Tax=Plakobranchus ocellatus TaxID=259542 RepID=A0AAV4BLQ7_9GAST|nr:hypothetical protein PoB_004758400 [Plakobranchus ocellatus]